MERGRLWWGIILAALTGAAWPLPAQEGEDAEREMRLLRRRLAECERFERLARGAEAQPLSGAHGWTRPAKVCPIRRGASWYYIYDLVLQETRGVERTLFEGSLLLVGPKGEAYQRAPLTLADIERHGGTNRLPAHGTLELRNLCLTVPVGHGATYVEHVFAAADPTAKALRFVTITPLHPSEPETVLAPPFAGRWQVLAAPQPGSRHFEAKGAARLAVEFGALGEEDALHRGAGEHVRDFYGFGQWALAPAAGLVVAVHDGEPTRSAREWTSASPTGNYVLVEHRPGEVSLVGYLRAGSLVVRPGARVRAGDRLGQVGASGSTRLPCIHYRLLDGSDLETAEALPPRFRRAAPDGAGTLEDVPGVGEIVTSTDSGEEGEHGSDR